jgi:uncharacterized protein (DUF305 family)
MRCRWCLRHAAAAMVSVGVLLAGCTTATADPEPVATARILQPGAPGEPNRELTPEEVAELDLTVEHTDADVAFMRDMIAHHVQALRMTQLVPSRTAHDQLPLFAERMDISQRDEIDLMRRWLEERDEDVPSLLAGHVHADADPDGADQLMPGMLTEAELSALEEANGEAFDRLFLESMIRHHLGALQMVEELYDAGGGEEPEIARFARDVYADQSIELDRMYALLAELDGPGGS